MTTIVAPDSSLPGEPVLSGKGAVIADLDFALIGKRKLVMDSRGHYIRPELLIDRRPMAHVHDRAAHFGLAAEQDPDDLRAAVA